MRSATAIVGAIAVSSILIALAFLSSGGSSSGSARTKTVTVLRSVAEPSARESSPSNDGRGPTGGLNQCGGGEFTVESVSCQVGEEIFNQYRQGSRGELVAEDPQTGESISVTCDQGTTPVTCEGAGGIRVYFAP